MDEDHEGKEGMEEEISPITEHHIGYTYESKIGLKWDGAMHGRAYDL